MRGSPLAVFAAAVALAALAAPDVALGQQPTAHRVNSVQPVRVELPASDPAAPDRSRENARADELEASAAALYNSPREWQTVAQLHRRAAGIRGDDPRAVQSWLKAAWAYSAVGDLGNAQAMMERAAERAAAGGDVGQAANSYVDAALIAVEEKRGDQVPGLLRKTLLLLGSPQFPADRRADVLWRMGGEAGVAKACNPQ
jgi:hypothetical protein